MGKIKRRKFGENLKVRVPDDPSAIVRLKILSEETFWDKGISRTPFENLKERQGYARTSLEVYF